jgi:hypothetical protein
MPVSLGPAIVSSATPARRADAGAPAATAQGPQTSNRRRDSVWNGALIGAGLGALVGAAAGNAALDTPTAGFNVPLTFGVVGAGAGLALGIGIDLLRERSHAALPPGGRRRQLVVSPVVGPTAKGVVAAMTF